MRFYKYSLILLIFINTFGPSMVRAEKVVSEIHAIDLGTLPGGSDSSATDINEGGNIVGYSTTASGEVHGFFYSAGSMTDIGVLPGGDTSRARGINDLDQVVGSSNLLNTVTGEKVFHGFIWQGGVLTDLGAFPPEDDINSTSAAYAINNSGLIAGNVDLAGVVWDLSGTPVYPPFPPYVRVTDPEPFRPAITYDINNAGQATGTALSYALGFLWQSPGPFVLLANIGGADDDAFGINQAGEIVGVGLSAPPPLGYHAVYWSDPASVNDLGTLGGGNSSARDINDDSTIVGYSETSTGNTVAFIWDAELGMQSLGTLGGSNSKAYAINSAGQIVGESETATGETHATLWTVTLATKVGIDVKPGNALNPVNPRSKGKLTVAILTDAHFDATSVNVSSVRLGTGEAVPVWNQTKDVDHDGDWDLILKFNTSETGIACGDTEISLKGLTVGDENILGTDIIRTVGCK